MHTSSWLRPAVEEGGLARYAAVVRERLTVVIAAFALTVGAAVAYLLVADDVYESEANLLVTPAPAEDPLLASLGLLRESSDPTRAVETVARLVTTVEIAEQVRGELRISKSAQDLLEDVQADPVAQSNIVAVAAEAGSPEAAEKLANAFAESVVADRTAKLHDEVDRLIPSLRERLRAAPPTGVAEAIVGQIGRLETLRSGADPTVHVETPATLPEEPEWPRPLLTLAGAMLAGIVLGMGAAFGAQSLDPRVRREEQLHQRFRLPVLARIPDQRRRLATALRPDVLSAPAIEAFQALRVNVEAAQRRRAAPAAILVTGASPAEGKTTTAINLAAALARAGHRTILIDADLRRPSIGAALGLNPESGVAGVVTGDVSLEEALLRTEGLGPDLGLLLAGRESSAIAEAFTLPTAEQLLDDARGHAEFVVLDSPPLSAVIDALPLAGASDEVLVVARLGVTRLRDLEGLAELLAGNDIAPQGFVLVGTAPPERDYYQAARSARTAGEAFSRKRHAPSPR